MKFSKIHQGFDGMRVMWPLLGCIAIVAASHSAIAAPPLLFTTTPSAAKNLAVWPAPHVRPLPSEYYNEVAASTTSSLKVGSLMGPPGAPLPLVIELPKDIEAQFSFAMIKGLPKDFKLSAGFQTNSAWLLLLNEVEGLIVTAPEDFQGQVQFEIVLFKDKHSAAITHKAEIDIQTRYAVQASSAEASSPDPAAAAAPLMEGTPSLLPEADKTAPNQFESASSYEEFQLLMKRANQALRNSDISSARQFYERLARSGMAEAAFAMGQTYDPSFLDQLSIHGLQPDLETAKLWYQKASELGSVEAKERLSSFSN